jgi:putative endonuclease
MWYVYVLKSLVNNRHYTGYTIDLEKRIEEHNRGKTKSIEFSRPYKLIYKETYNTRIEAARRERFLKSGKGREFLKNMGI